MGIGLEEVVAYVKFWDVEITRLGGYAPKEKTATKRISKKQGRVRRSSKTRPAVGTPLVISEPRCQSLELGQWRES
jgi:hypothetical protein